MTNTNGIHDTNGVESADIPVDTPKPPRERYSAIRGYLAAAKKRNGELPAETYLLGQLALIATLLLEEMSDVRIELAIQNAFLNDMAVHGMEVKK